MATETIVQGYVTKIKHLLRRENKGNIEVNVDVLRDDKISRPRMELALNFKP